jgi:hypothetical protein
MDPDPSLQERMDAFQQQHILGIWDKKQPTPRTAEEAIDVSTVRILRVDSRNPIWRLVIGDRVIKKNNTYVVHYRCGRCAREHVEALNSLMKKVNKGYDVGASCVACVGQGSMGSMGGMGGGDRGCGNSGSLSSLVDDAERRFRTQMDDDFARMYFRKYLTVEEFDRLRPNILSFGGGKFTDVQAYAYVPCAGVPGKTDAFLPALYDARRDVVEKCLDFELRCDACATTFRCREIFAHKNRWKVLCEGCKFADEVPRYHYWDNCEGRQLSYANKIELNTIKFCNDHGIVLENGPMCVVSSHHGSRRIRPSFYAPALKVMLDVDNKQSDWAARRDALRRHCLQQQPQQPQQKNLSFHGIDRRNFMQVMKMLLRLHTVMMTSHEKI